MKHVITIPEDSPCFPGAIDSPFSSNMEWIVPAEHPRIPTFRILNIDNKIEDASLLTSEIPKDEIVRWYKNMVTGTFVQYLARNVAKLMLRSSPAKSMSWTVSCSMPRDTGALAFTWYAAPSTLSIVTSTVGRDTDQGLFVSY